MLVRVVEDHPDIAELLRIELVHAGFETDIRTGGFGELLTPEAWADVDACVFDLQLGDDLVDGGNLVIFVADRAARVRRVILTASPEAHLTPAVRSAAHVVLDKPTRMDTLMEALRGT